MGNGAGFRTEDGLRLRIQAHRPITITVCESSNTSFFLPLLAIGAKAQTLTITHATVIDTVFVEHELDIVRKLHAANVPFLAGTDTPAGVDVIPGISLHLELQRFVAAALPHWKLCRRLPSTWQIFITSEMTTAPSRREGSPIASCSKPTH
jgi:hypothetical protein